MLPDQGNLEQEPFPPHSVRQRYLHWWANDLYDRALLQVTAPRDPSRDSLMVPGVRNRWKEGPVPPVAQWTDIDFMIWRMEEELRTTFYAGEALPLFYHGWSAGHALLLGCQPTFTPDTVWVDPLPVLTDGHPPIHFFRQGEWWRWMLECTRRAARSSQGRYYLMPMWGNHAGDTLALLRGTQQLMVDMLADPSWVRQAVRQVSGILLEVYASLWELVNEHATGLDGSLNYCATWSPGKTMAFDCDISCCISPALFQGFFLPPLVETMRSVDHRIYHLDGGVALQHLELLLSVPEIDAIQWVPGAGREAILQWVPLIRRIQQSGKAVLVQAQPGEIPALLDAVSARGLCISTRCASASEARQLIELVGKSSRP